MFGVLGTALGLGQKKEAAEQNDNSFLEEALGFTGAGLLYNQIFGQEEMADPQAPEATDPAAIRQQGLDNQRLALRQRGASRTLLTGGFGLTEQPSVASAILLGG